MLTRKNGRYTFVRMVRLLSVILISFIFLGSSANAGSDSGSFAPLNPLFLDYLANHGGARSLMKASSGNSLGFVPSPHDHSHLKKSALLATAGSVGYPSSYDLRTQGTLTPVRDQGACGSCWAFGTYGSFESDLLPSETWDFSENNLKNTHGFDLAPCSGGNWYMSAAYLARWSGPIQESDDPYNASSGASPPGLSARKHLQQITLLPGRANALDNNSIKQALTTYGALMTLMYWDQSYYRSASSSYYFNGASSINHAVTIVGWDDNFSAGNFSIAPPGSGAFIVKNSWGTSFGEQGYFYVSYYDSLIGTDTVAFSGAESTTNYNRVYQYDPLGWVFDYGYGGTTGWFANVFTAVADEGLSAVSFYAASDSAGYEIRVYTNVTTGPTTGTLAATKIGSLSAGYHTISLDTPVPLSSSQRFSVVVKLTTPGYTYPIPVEGPYSAYSSNATANPGESFISSDGTSWQDMTQALSNANVCVKAFTSACSVSLSPGSHSLGPAGGSGSVAVTTQAGCPWTVTNSSAWITLTSPASGTGSGTVTYTVPQYSGGAGRTGSLTIGGQAYTVNQSAPNGVYTVPLSQGWNLISLPIQPWDTAITSVLSGITGKYSIVWAYGSEGWTQYAPTDPEGASLTTMEAGYGYWVKMTSVGSISLLGTQPQTTLNLSSGWNLAGYSSTTEAQASNVLSSIAGKYQVVWAYTNGQWDSYDPHDPDGMTLTRFAPCQGYWIKTTGLATWTLP